MGLRVSVPPPGDSNAVVTVLPTPAALASQLTELDARLGGLERTQPEDRVSLVAFSGDMDKLMAAFIIATGAAAMGSQVTMFFTFWGLAAIKKERVFKGKTIWEKILAFMLPAGPRALPTSSMNMAGIGPRFFNMMMGKKNVQSLPDLVELARELGVEMYGCQMSMDVMGIKKEELIEEVELCGVAGFLGRSTSSRTTLFI
jgi:peroxiredoxin family protein